MPPAIDKQAEGEGKRVKFVGKPLALLRAEPVLHGWERFGKDHGDTSIAPYIEGAWMNKHDSRYYLQYAARAPSTTSTPPESTSAGDR